MNKKDILKKWTEYLLIILNIICIIVISGDCDSISLFILKEVISVSVLLFNSIILVNYGR